MKKYVLLVMFVSICLSSVFASNDVTDIMSRMKQMNVELLNFSNKMASCTSYKQQLSLYSRPVIYEIVGLEGNSCHVIKDSQDCYYPKDVLQVYAYKKIQDYRKNIDNINNKRAYSSVSTNDDYYNRIDNMYCKF